MENDEKMNTGDWNTGRYNIGDRNSGDWNIGGFNSGDRNTGHQNHGSYNSGGRNSGRANTGNCNAGDWNTGDVNTGSGNSGNRNTGDWNSGDWNSGDWNTGFFNTETPKSILAFNKPVNRGVWKKAYKPKFLFFSTAYWIPESEMTAAEKAADTDCSVRGGQLRTIPYKEAFKRSWDNADPKDRMRVKDLPKFDEEVFFEISGIRVSDYEGESNDHNT